MPLTLGGAVSQTDLGYLLHKNPSRIHSFEMPFGMARVFQIDAPANQSAVALLLDVDPVELVRGRGEKSSSSFSLRQYVNDRPYAATSFLSVALARVFGTAMSGRSKERQELADSPREFSAAIVAAPCRGGVDFAKRLFEPLGYHVEAERHPLDEQFPEWGEGPYYTLRLSGRLRLRELLAHLYVLIPVLDAEKHYWVGESEVEKLLRKGEGWLAKHPEKDAIAHRYLARQYSLARVALSRLEDDGAEPLDELSQPNTESGIERPLKLWEQRIESVLSMLKSLNAVTILDLGCGEGKLIKALMPDRAFQSILGMDVSSRALERAADRLRLDQLATSQRERVRLIQGSLLYRDKRLEGFDAATVIEVIEHLDTARLAAFERVVFEQARPRHVIITTPNIEYNVCFETLPPGVFRHDDHRFEWTRDEFRSWAEGVARRYGYSSRLLAVGLEDPVVGPPTQMGVFTS
ncbi:MAG: 3' terminal RNA ribose 2'-O-methyltransferase Hen1 [Acidobacteria bacterium]|nr:3' terminal RNA ribose 2'-O-methyltransferase Hen1 [Acidobacteriota bacterium]